MYDHHQLKLQQKEKMIFGYSEKFYFAVFYFRINLTDNDQKLIEM